MTKKIDDNELDTSDFDTDVEKMMFKRTFFSARTLSILLIANLTRDLNTSHVLHSSGHTLNLMSS